LRCTATNSSATRNRSGAGHDAAVHTVRWEGAHVDGHPDRRVRRTAHALSAGPTCDERGRRDRPAAGGAAAAAHVEPDDDAESDPGHGESDTEPRGVAHDDRDTDALAPRFDERYSHGDPDDDAPDDRVTVTAVDVARDGLVV
jgi:hypothetical protein